MQLLVTGATGNVGADVVRQLSGTDAHVRAAVRDPDRTDEPDWGANVNPVRFDFTDAATYGPALDGVDRVFLVRPPAISDVKTHIRPFIRACREAGVAKIVFLSLFGVERNPVVPHRTVEADVREVGIPHTFLRASFFMQNFSTAHRAEIRDRDEIFVPAGHGKTSFVDCRDVAEVAVRALTDETAEAYDLTGPEALDYDAVAEIFTEVLGRPITYRDPSL